MVNGLLVVGMIKSAYQFNHQAPDTLTRIAAYEYGEWTHPPMPTNTHLHASH